MSTEPGSEPEVARLDDVPAGPAQPRWVPTATLVVAGIGVVAAVVMGMAWRSAVADLDELRAEIAAEQAAAAAEDAALPDLAAVAERTISDARAWDGDESYVTLTFHGSTVGALDSLDEFLDELGFNPAARERMSRTRALDGTQTAEGDGVNATWTFHPDNGLQIVVERD